MTEEVQFESKYYENFEEVEYELDEDVPEVLKNMGPYSWCVLLTELPMLAEHCPCWSELPNCQKAWDDLIAKYPTLMNYVVASL